MVRQSFLRAKVDKMKENNGRGARRLMIRRMGLLGSVLLGFALVMLCFVLNNNNNNGRSSSSSSQRSTTPLDHSPRRERHKLKKKALPKIGIRPKDYDAILEAKVHLVELHDMGGKIEDITASFCRLNWDLHKNEPSKYPMYRDLVGNSPDCQDALIFVNFQQIVKRVRSYDREYNTNVLDLTAAVFHESRCGSTLTANLLASWRPAEHRVYSESTPPLQALNQVCGEDYDLCDLETAAGVLQDVVYLMSRSDDEKEKRVFFKIQSAGSRHIQIFQHAFPETPYLFVYREPVQVLMSQLAHGVKGANCVRNYRQPPKSIQRILRKYGEHDRPSMQDFCAAHLASITENVVESMTEQGIPVNYRDLPDILYTDIFPSLMEGASIAPADLDRMQEVDNIYSKGRGNKAGMEFEEDSEHKEDMADEMVRSAAETYLSESYQQLEKLAAKRRG